MKIFMIASFFTLLAYNANASTYDCTFSNGANSTDDAITFKFDTNTADNKLVDLENGSFVGCVVFRATPELIGCGIGIFIDTKVEFSIVTTTDNGSSLLSLDTTHQGSKTNLSCIKKN